MPVNTIGQYSLNEKDNEKAIKLSDSVVDIEDMAFTNNTGLEIIVMGSGTKSIGEGAFLGCSSLKEVVLNDGLETISGYAFS